MAKVQVEQALLGRPDLVRYYGNMLHVEEIAQYLPLKFQSLDINNLTNLQTWTKRKIEIMRCGSITQPLTVGGFYKATGIKWLESRVYNVGESFACQPDDTIYYQETVDIIDEIRCFVKNGEILTASWYRKNKIFDPEPLEDAGILRDMQNMTRDIWKSAKWPNGIVFDFGILRDGSILFIEANEAYASGLYQCNPARCLDVIIASQTQ